MQICVFRCCRAVVELGVGITAANMAVLDAVYQYHFWSSSLLRVLIVKEQ